MKKRKSKKTKKISKKDKDFFLNDSFLKEFINLTSLNEKRKKYLKGKLSEFGEEERKSLLVFLKDVYLLDMEEEEAIERIRKSISA